MIATTDDYVKGKCFGCGKPLHEGCWKYCSVVCNHEYVERQRELRAEREENIRSVFIRNSLKNRQSA